MTKTKNNPNLISDVSRPRTSRVNKPKAARPPTHAEAMRSIATRQAKLRNQLGKNATHIYLPPEAQAPTEHKPGPAVSGPAGAKFARAHLRRLLEEPTIDDNPNVKVPKYSPRSKSNSTLVSKHEIQITPQYATNANIITPTPKYTKYEHHKYSRLRKTIALGIAAISLFGLSFTQSSNKSAGQTKSSAAPKTITHSPTKSNSVDKITVKSHNIEQSPTRAVHLDEDATTPWGAAQQEVGAENASAFLEDKVSNSDGELSWQGTDDNRYLVTDDGSSDSPTVIKTINNLK